MMKRRTGIPLRELKRTGIPLKEVRRLMRRRHH